MFSGVGHSDAEWLSRRIDNVKALVDADRSVTIGARLLNSGDLGSLPPDRIVLLPEGGRKPLLLGSVPYRTLPGLAAQADPNSYED